MPQDGIEPIADNELLFRRIPASQGWYSPESSPPVSPEAFHPNKDHDKDGLSVWREKHTHVADAARGRPGKTYFVGVMRAGDLRAHGVLTRPDPLPNQPGHALLPGINSANRRSNEVSQIKSILAEKCVLRVEGPFLTPPDANHHIP